MLAAGGNAVDAAVAAAFASGVAEPGVSSLAGGGFLLHRDPRGRVRLTDFFSTVPSGHGRAPDRITVTYAGATQDFHVGPGSIAVPGCLDGLLHVQRQWGRMPLRDVIGPAIDYAANGVALDAGQAQAMSLIGPVLTYSERGRRLNSPGGRMLEQGDRFADQELADLLTAVADEQVTGMRDLVDRFAALDASCSVAPGDLTAYRVVDREPLVRQIRGGTLYTNPLPSLGGSIVAHVLADLVDQAHPTPRAIAEALVETTSWLKSQVSGRGSSIGTTHISVIDSDGGCAALTLSNGLGSGVFLPGTGLHLNNMMGEDDLHPDGAASAVPGQRIHSMMAPSIVDFPGGRLVLGTGGSERIRSALTRVITLMLAGEPDLVAAVTAPRVHVDNNGTIQVEPGFSQEEVADLARLGPVNVWPVLHFYFGGINAVLARPDGATVACADPRRGGGSALV